MTKEQRDELRWTFDASPFVMASGSMMDFVEDAALMDCQRGVKVNPKTIRNNHRAIATCNYIENGINALPELLDDLDRLEADAARYRWFREQMHSDAIQCPVSVIWGWCVSDEMQCIKSAEQLDQVIDEAMKEST